MFVRNRYSRFEKVVLGFRSIPSTIAMASASNCEQNTCVVDALHSWTEQERRIHQ
jgi:hypothetical protein